MKKSNSVLLSLGSNLGNRLLNINQASELMEKEAGVIKKKSLIYETTPWGKKNQPDFLNQVIELDTSLTARELLVVIQNIEKQLGRVRDQKWGARTIDIDILYFGDQVIEEKDLIIPHPLLTQRKFILVPLAKISPGFIHPVLEKNNSVLLQECNDTLNVTEFTN
ncbi:MAG: 2-amino-4-hydroxy-6-hydroxymethyldihydropteridine pyrophosphokinase [Cytophagales bacterium]|jgi:2-amino-4-hydroxy-6-hydroxymethyldihydropteridine diphosphokinase|nr:2-amino-4-hydroxy-6-hydroxymethyldihydropteridine diphosphokinase [Bacteroidota bacterium]MBS1981920.1 2-amino-4-hydroxy-6-hydroxymethyldihydropteridine diphosphokinase [Bacteroidota bacterium]WHZ09368.1 MAG: 2-amino-4-hydroxy-6-hydroxymethyldihydropteridine pyrophosphokinase [Cytophagales bacterium]